MSYSSTVAFEKRILPLAGVVQAVHLVIGAAKNGLVSQDSMEKSLNPIFVQSPDSIAEVYSGVKDISLGLNLVKEILNEFSPERHGELVRYSLAVVGLERALASQPHKLQALGDAIAKLSDDKPVDSDQLIKELAEIYEAIIGTIEPRIKISGNRGHLQNIANIQRIRALLLSAIRSAVLWHQVGGRRWQLILQRNRYKAGLATYL